MARVLQKQRYMATLEMVEGVCKVERSSLSG